MDKYKQKFLYLFFLLSQLPLYVGVTGITVQIQSVIDTTGFFFKLVNTFNAVKDNCFGVEHNIFNITTCRPPRLPMGMIFMTNVCANGFINRMQCLC